MQTLRATGQCDRAFQLARERYGHEVIYKKTGVVLGTAASAGITGISGAAGLVAGVGALLVICSPFIALDMLTNGSANAAAGCIEVFNEVAGDIVKGSVTAPWQGTRSLRQANYDGVSAQLRESAQCYLDHVPGQPGLTKARAAYGFLQDDYLRENISRGERLAIDRLGNVLQARTALEAGANQE